MKEVRQFDKKKMKLTPIQVRFTPALEAAVEKLAAHKGCSRATLVRMAVMEYIYQHAEVIG